MKIRVSVPIEFEVEFEGVDCVKQDAERAAAYAAYQCLAWYDGGDSVTQEVDGIGKCKVRLAE